MREPSAPEPNPRMNLKRRRLTAYTGADCLTRSKSDPLLIECHPPHWRVTRQFDFRDLRRFLVQERANDIAEHFGDRLIRLARITAVSRYCAIRDLLLRAATNFKKLRRPKFSSFSDEEARIFWQATYNDEFSRIRAKVIKLTSQAEILNALNIAIDELASTGIGPSIELESMPRNYHGAAGRRPSLLEQNDGEHTSATKAALTRMRSSLERHGVSIDDEGDRFLASLIASPRLQTLVDEQSIYSAMLEENRERLARLRAAAEDKFCYWRTIYLDGQTLLQQPRTQAFLRIGQKSNIRNEAYRSGNILFPEDDIETATKNLLAVSEEFYGSMVPSNKEVDWGSRHMKAVAACGGIFYLDAMLCPHRQAVACAAFLYLIDSGANISTALQLRTNFEELTDDPNLVRVKSHKPRSGYQAIIDTLPVKEAKIKFSAVEALRFIRDATAKRRASNPHLADHLFVFRYFGSQSVAIQSFLGNQMSYLTRDEALPNVWTAGAIRQSVAMAHTSKNLSSLRGLTRKLHHRKGSNTTPFYALSFPIRGLLEQRIRHFQQVYQTAIADNLTDGLSALGYQTIDMELLRSQVQRTGLGPLCLRKLKLASAAADSGCSEVGLCPGCTKQIFVPDENSLAEVIAVREVLLKRSHQLQTDEPGRWSYAWVHLLAYTIVVLERVQRSAHARHLGRAREIARDLVSCGFDPTTLRPRPQV